jgi:hypothetical protein
LTSSETSLAILGYMTYFITFRIRLSFFTSAGLLIGLDSRDSQSSWFSSQFGFLDFVA